MDSTQNVSLAKHSTMRLGGTAAHLMTVRTGEQLQEAVAWAQEHSLPFIVIGHGSNIVWRDEGFRGLVIVNNIMGFSLADHAEYTLATIGAGEPWDSVVERTVQHGLSGIEALSLIPGTAGATPVQNVGAYGQEIAQTLVSVEAYDSQQRKVVTLAASDCAFGYRTSRFKTTDRGVFAILRITLRLTRTRLRPPFYDALQRYVDEQHITDYSPSSIRSAVVAIRRSKLPDPAVVANNGSFFANPIVDAKHLLQLQATHRDVPHWPTPDGRAKVSAAWLVDHAGFKNHHDPTTGMATWPTQPLVLVNEHARSTADLLAFRQKIVTAVHQKFGITLEQEPELLP